MLRGLFVFALRLFDDLIPGQPLQLVAPVERLDEALRLAPAGLDDDVQFQINPRAEQRLDLAAGAGADLLQLGAAFADQNRLLPVALAIDGRGDAGERQAGRGWPFLRGGAGGSGSSKRSMTTAEA